MNKVKPKGKNGKYTVIKSDERYYTKYGKKNE
jgi:hypothetical protein